MSVKLLTEHHLELLSLKGDCTGWSESTVAKMPHCWKSHVIWLNNVVAKHVSLDHPLASDAKPKVKVNGLFTGFPQALESKENLENHSNVPCMEKSWNLKKNLNNHGKTMELCEII